MDVICFEDKAYYAIIDKLVAYIKEKHTVTEDKWIQTDEAMRLLNITSKTTLQKFRDEGVIRFTQPTRKNTLYDRDSINDYLESKAKETF